MNENINKGEKKVKPRSRLYPRYDLEEAIRFMQCVHNLGGSKVSNQAVASEVGKALNNSGFIGRVSSAKQFGLLNQESGKLSETSLAKEIFVPRSEVEKAKAVKQALSTPDLYKEILTDFAGKALPEQSALANRLFHDYRMAENAKDEASKNFIRSVQFAGVLKNGILVISADETILTSDEHVSDDTVVVPSTFRGSNSPSTGNQGAVFQDSGVGWSIAIKSQKPLNSEAKKKLIEVAELLDKVNAEDSG